MNHSAAAILDAARAGEPVTDEQITQALIDSGDLEADEWPMVRRHRGVGEWEFITRPACYLAEPFDMIFDRSKS